MIDALKIPHSGVLFALFFSIVVLSVIGALVLNDFKVLAAPIACLVVYLAVVDYKKLYYLLWFTIPFSTEVEFGSLGSDLPDEPLMLMCTAIVIGLIAGRSRHYKINTLLHPISLMLLVHLAWICVTAVTSQAPMISWKFFLAKFWYLGAFYILTLLILDLEKDMKVLVKIVTTATLFTILYAFVRHAGHGFSFSSINEVLVPLYRNHVDYALTLGALFPFVWFYRNAWKGKYTGLIICFIFLLAIYFAYTRAAYIGLVIAGGAILVMRLKLMRFAILASVIAAIGIVSWLATDNRYIDYAPEYEKTITHEQFDDLIEATYQLEDISTMERVYRWVAGFYMYAERPVVGFGPGSFYTFYKSYTDEHFVTYVSDNPERSGTHNYYLMTLVEQGVPGLIFFVLLCFVALAKAEWLYHRLEKGPARDALMAATSALVFICVICLLNDMIETDKVGSFFFLSLAIIVALDRYLPKANGKPEQSVASPDSRSKTQGQ